MPAKGTIVRILIASPSDCVDERQVIPEVAYAWNAANTLTTDTLIEPVKWETHAIPELGDRPQALLNRRLVATSDILVGTFWTRLGTDTGLAASGTAEEIEQFRSAGKHVLLYFSKAPIPPDKIDFAQYEKLKAYKKQLQAYGITFDYDSVQQLRHLFTQHLAAAMGELIASSGAAELRTARPVSSAAATDYLGNLLAAAYKHVDTYVRYSQSPPVATYEQFAASEDALKTALFENRLRVRREHLDKIEELIKTIRSKIALGNMMVGLFGGDGRPSEKDLTEFQNEMLKLLKGVEDTYRAAESRPHETA